MAALAAPEAHTDDLPGLLGVSPDASASELLAAYRRQRAAAASDEQRDELRWAYRALADRFFASVWHNYGTRAALAAAGYFDDGVEPEQVFPDGLQLDWMTTPVAKARAQMLAAPTQGRLAVLLSTGGFSPIHDGHLQMMRVAREELQARGVPVIGGYLSPSHDDYVSVKYDGAAALSIGHRLRLCEEAVADSDWLAICPWEGRYTATDINFTDVFVRLEAYLRRHVSERIDLYYVFGADNGGFAMAFAEHGHCVCVPRAGHEQTLRDLSLDPLLANNPRTVLASTVSQAATVSSSAIRAGAITGLPPRVQALRERWQAEAQRSEPLCYVLRDDLQWAVEPWQARHETQRLRAAASDFGDGLAVALREAFAHASSPDVPHQLDLRRYSQRRQAAYVRQLRAQGAVLSLDVASVGDHHLDVSRRFALADGQCHASALIARPSFAALADQAQALPAGDYTLVDDDIATGYTMDAVTALLPDGVRVAQRVSLLEQSARLHRLPEPADVYDVVDARDFLLGARAGGLAVSLPDGRLARAPYALPYVCLATRAKVPPSREYELARAVWQLNEAFFASVPQLRVADCDEPTKALLDYLGFAAQTPLAEVCAWHLRQLERLPFALTDRR